MGGGGGGAGGEGVRESKSHKTVSTSHTFQKER